MRTGNIANLVPQSTRTPEEAREMGRNGGKRSGEVRRQKKLLSQIYGEMLAGEFDVLIEGKPKKLAGTKFVQTIVREVLNRRDSASVAMLREIREATDKLDGRKQDEGLVIIIDGEDVIASTDKQTIPS